MGIHWSKEEDKILENNYELPVKQIVSIFKTRTENSIKQRKRKLGLKNNKRSKWLESELEILKNNRELSNSEIAIILKRTKDSVSSKRSSLNLTKNKICEFCNSEFYIENSNSQICLSCNPGGKRNKHSPFVRYSHYKEGAIKRKIEFKIQKANFLNSGRYHALIVVIK